MSHGIDEVDNEDQLYELMSKTEDFEERKKIRARIREVRDKKPTIDADARRKEREQQREDAIQMRIRQAEEDKQRKLKEFDQMAKAPKKESSTAEDRIKEKHAAADKKKQEKLEELKENAKVISKSYHSGSDQITLDHIKRKEDEKADKMKEFSEDAVSKSTRTENVPGGSRTTTTSKTTHTSKDGSTTVTKTTKQVTQTASIGGTSYNISKTSADAAARQICDTFSQNALDGTSGSLTVRTEAWSSKDGITHRTEKTKTWGGAKTGPRSAMAAFQGMDNANNPDGGAKPNIGGGRGLQRSGSAIKEMLLTWIQKQVNHYPNVNVTNFSSSWNDGMAFCALIHNFHPEAFDFNKLDPKRRGANFKLAFTVAEKVADIAPLLDVEDMVRMKNPDWKCVFTYVQSYYRKFRDHENNRAGVPASPED